MSDDETLDEIRERAADFIDREVRQKHRDLTPGQFRPTTANAAQ